MSTRTGGIKTKGYNDTTNKQSKTKSTATTTSATTKAAKKWPKDENVRQKREQQQQLH